MTTALGNWAWWNQYGSVSLERCVERAQGAGLAGVIVKWGYRTQQLAFEGAGLPWATERYVYPDQARAEAEHLASDIAHGARFAVINAEVEWEGLGRGPMELLIGRFRELQPDAELYASVDTRGNRMSLPYQRVLAEHVTGWMPMIYPKAFQQSAAAAFRASLDGKDFRGEAVLPTIQTYDNIGAQAVRDQLDEVERRGLPGCQAYTIAHATEEEWAAFAERAREEDDVDEQARAQIAALKQQVDFLTGALGTTRTETQQALRQAGFLANALVVHVQNADPSAAPGLARRVEEIEEKLAAAASALEG